MVSGDTGVGRGFFASSAAALGASTSLATSPSDADAPTAARAFFREGLAGNNSAFQGIAQAKETGIAIGDA